MTTIVERPAQALRARPAGTRPLTGAGALIRFMLRRDRVRIPGWLGAITLFNILTATNYPDIYATREDRQIRADLVESPGVRMLTGPGYGLEDYTFGAMMGNEHISTVAIPVAVMSILLLVRHTRTEEETGRAELVRAAVVGRHAHTFAALVVVGGASVALGLLTALGLGSVGVESITWDGSWLYGTALASIGMLFAAVTAVTVQLTGYGRAAGGLAGAVFGAGFLLRGAGDAAQVGGGPPSWLSPIGWAQQTRVYVDGRWWPLLPPVVLAAALAALALWLSTRRDIGEGLRPPRPGPSGASARLAGPLGLAWRQHRTSILSWGGVMLLVGLFYGTLTADFGTFVDEFSALDDWMEQVGGDTVVESWIATLVLMMTVPITVFAVLAVLRPRVEETAGRAEPILATATSRTRWVGSHLVVALAGSVVLLALTGLGFGFTTAVALEDEVVLPRVLGAAVAYTPAVWVTVALGVALFGLVPRASGLVWLVVAYEGVVGTLGGPLLGLPDWMMSLSPFAHVPMLPAEEMSWVPLPVLTVIAAGLVAAGLAGFRRRDLESN